VAIKLLHHNLATDQVMNARFLREAQLASNLRGENIAEVYDYGLLPGGAYLVSRFVDGSSLERRLEEAGCLKQEEAHGIFLGILQGLSVVHAEGVIHRDLKPANILLTKGGQAVITDFGLARQEVDGGELTGTGVVLGTPAYMAPEQIMGDFPTPAWDLYATGLILFRMLAGKLPFKDGNIGEVLQSKMESLDSAIWSSALGTLGVQERQLLQLLLAQDPDERPIDAGAALAFLRQEAPDADPPEPCHVTPQIDTLSHSSGGYTPLSGASLSVSSFSTVKQEPPSKRPTALFILPLLLAFTALGFFFWPQNSTENAPPPPSGIPQKPLPEVDPVLASLVASFQDRMERHQAVAEAIGMQGQDATLEQVQLFLKGRVAFAKLVRESGLRTQLLDSQESPLDPSTYSHLSRIALVERLLSRARIDKARLGEELPPLYPPGENPELDRFLGKGCRWVADPIFESGADPVDWERERPYLALMQEEKRIWLPLRRYQDLGAVVKGKPIYYKDTSQVATNRDIAVQTYFGDLFENPLKDVNAMVQLAGRSTWNVDKYDDATEIKLPMKAPANGDLFLAFGGAGWSLERHALFQLDGTQDRLEVIMTFQPPKHSGQGIRLNQDLRIGGFLRIPRALIPSGLRRLQIKAIGIQPITQVTSTVKVEEIYQLQRGPPPLGFKD
jgi:serine/threonine protein kinase